MYLRRNEGRQYGRARFGYPGHSGGYGPKSDECRRLRLYLIDDSLVEDEGGPPEWSMKFFLADRFRMNPEEVGKWKPETYNQALAFLEAKSAANKEIERRKNETPIG